MDEQKKDLPVDKKPIKNPKFGYKLIRRLAQVGITTNENKYGSHDYLTCLDLLDLGRGPEYYIAKYSTEYYDKDGNPKMVKGWRFTQQELENLATALSSL